MKKPSTKALSVSALQPSPAAAAGVTDPIPTVDPPQPPAGFSTSTRLARGVRPQRVQIDLAPRVSAELRADTSYAQRFGDAVPDRDAVANALTSARAWSDKLRLASEWAEYVRQQEHLAWRHAMALTADLKVPFDFRATRDPSVLAELPSLAAFFEAMTARARRGAATRVRNAKLGAKARKGEGEGAAPPKDAASAAPVMVVDAVKTAAVKLLN